MKIVRIALIGVILVLTGGGESYRRLEGENEVRFYRSRAVAFRGRRLHLHLPMTPFLKKPDREQPTPGSPEYDCYTYRKVKFLVRPDNPHYQQFRRKRKQGKIVCVKGRVVRLPGKTGTVRMRHPAAKGMNVRVLPGLCRAQSRMALRPESNRSPGKERIRAIRLPRKA